MVVSSSVWITRKASSTPFWPMAPLATVSIFGMLVGVTSTRDAVISEISDVAGAVQDINMCFSFTGLVGHSSSSCGSSFIDVLDFCDDADDVSGEADNCITFDSGGSETVVSSATYTNPDTETDISASQNPTNIKWGVERGNDADADALTDAIVDCLDAGHEALITWTTAVGDPFSFTATSLVSGGPEDYLFAGSSSGTGSGKIISASLECVDRDGTSGGDAGVDNEE